MFLFLYKFYLKHFSFWEELSEIWSKVYIGLHVKYPLFLSDFNKICIFSTDFRKILKYQIAFKKKSSRSRGVPCGRTWRSYRVALFAILGTRLKIICDTLPPYPKTILVPPDPPIPSHVTDKCTVSSNGLPYNRTLFNILTTNKGHAVAQYIVAKSAYKIHRKP